MTEKQAIEQGLLSAEIKPGGAKPKNHTALDEFLATRGESLDERAADLKKNPASKRPRGAKKTEEKGSKQ